MLTDKCSQCGAQLAPGRSCRDYFHDLLALEADVAGAPGAQPHFFAVASYNLQHPDGFMPSALVGLRQTLADVLAGKATMAGALSRARAASDGSVRVRRREDTILSAFDRQLLQSWPTEWAMTVRDVIALPPSRYVEQVRAWATTVTAALDHVLDRK